MLHRLVAMLIVGFWLAMTGLLVVRELYPEATRLNSVPVSYVGRLIFQHHQPSSLKIYDTSGDVGYLNLDPKPVTDTGRRIVDVNGNLGIHPLGSSEQRFAWHGKFELDPAYSLKRLWLTLSTQDGGQLAMDVDVANGTATYNIGASAIGPGSETITLDEKGLAKLLDHAGVSAAVMRQFRSGTAQMPSTEFSSQQSTTKLGGETLSTYLLSMKVGGQTMFEAHISQLGQVLRAQIPLFGYKLMPDNVTP